MFPSFGAMLAKGLLFPSPFSQSPVKSPKCESAFFSLAHRPKDPYYRPKDPGPNNCILVDWAWFTAAKYGLITNQVVRKSHKSPQGKNAIPPKQ